MFFRFSFVMAQSILSICRAFVMLPGLSGGELSENLCPGVGNLSILLDAVNVVLFSIFHLKKCVYLNHFRYIYKKNIFNNYTLKRYMWFSLHHFPIPQYFFACVCFSPSLSVCTWRKNNKCVV